MSTTLRLATSARSSASQVTRQTSPLLAVPMPASTGPNAAWIHAGRNHTSTPQSLARSRASGHDALARPHRGLGSVAPPRNSQIAGRLFPFKPSNPPLTDLPDSELKEVELRIYFGRRVHCCLPCKAGAAAFI
jgi:hypothetical protein